MTHYCVSGWPSNRGLTEEMRSASALLMGGPGGSTSGCLQMESNTSDVLAPLKGSWPKIHWKMHTPSAQLSTCAPQGKGCPCLFMLGLHEISDKVRTTSGTLWVSLYPGCRDSGALNAGVPLTCIVQVWGWFHIKLNTVADDLLGGANLTWPSHAPTVSWYSSAEPKSTILMRPSPPRSRFAGLRSPCTTWFA